MTNPNFTVDAGLQETETVQNQKIAPFLQDVMNTAQPAANTGEKPEYEKWGLRNQQEMDLMKYVKDTGGSADDFTFVLEDFRNKSFEKMGVEEVEEDVSGLDIGVKAGEGIREVGEVLKIESKFDIDESENVTLGGSIKNQLKTLANAGRFATNVPGDAIQFAGDIVGLVSDPIGTLTSIKDVAVGVADKIGIAEGTEEQQAMVSAIGTALEENFGTGERAIETITQNPVDALFAVFGGASAAKAGLQQTQFAKTAAGANTIKRLENIQQATNPLNVVKTELLAAKELAPVVATAPFKGSAAAVRALTPEKAAKAIAGIDDIEAGVLAKTSKSKFDEIVDVAEQATKNLDAPTPFELAGNKAIGALDELKVQKNLAGKTKSEALAKVADNVIDTKPIIDKFDDLLSDRFNVRVLEDGTLGAVKGKIPKNVDELKAFADQLNELRTAPQGKITLGNLDALVDNLQDSINFSKLQRAGAATTKTEKTIAGFTEDINKSLKSAAGKEFVKANEDFRKAANLSTDLEKALGGATGDRAGSLFKSVFSPQTGGKTKRIFREVRELTGTDLFDEAALAKFAMEAVGDTRGLSLLDAAVGAGITGFAPPVSVQGALQKVFQPTKVARGLTQADKTSMLDKVNKGVKLTTDELGKLTDSLGLSKAGTAINAKAGDIFDDLADIVGARAKIIGGERAKFSLLGKKADAEILLKSGVSPQRAFEQTGWFKGPDGKLRFEISDKLGKLKNVKSPEKVITIKDFLDHKELYSNYPKVANLDLKLIKMGDAHGGFYHPGSGTIVLNSSKTPKQMKSSLLHEIQHIIQDVEGFAKGGIPEKSIKLGNPIAIAQSKELKRVLKQLRKEIQGAPRDAKKDMIKQRLEINKQIRELETSPNDLYRRLYGEIEARNVQSRLADPNLRGVVPIDTQDVGIGKEIIQGVDKFSGSKVTDASGMKVADGIFQEIAKRSK